MKLIAGLGNPGAKYHNTRHNAGFMSLDHFASAHAISFKNTDRFKAELAELSDHEKVILLKPQTFMNNSGKAVRAAIDFYKISVSDLLVVYDELALPFGSIRTREGGRSAGHNGIKSIITSVGEGFQRVRIGIANTQSTTTDASEFVLAEFSSTEKPQLGAILDQASALIKDFIDTGQLTPETIKF